MFFPVATVIGALAVLLWPLHFAGIVSSYPGEIHARLMVYGFFGGFILGFLGTALPRMLSANPLGIHEAGTLVVIYAAMVAS